MESTLRVITLVELLNGDEYCRVVRGTGLAEGQMNLVTSDVSAGSVCDDRVQMH